MSKAEMTSGANDTDARQGGVWAEIGEWVIRERNGHIGIRPLPRNRVGAGTRQACIGAPNAATQCEVGVWPILISYDDGVAQSSTVQTAVCSI